MQTIKDVPILIRREIEALMIAPFLEAFAEEIGEEKMLQIASKVIAKIASESGEQMAKLAGDNSLDTFIDRVTPMFAQGGALRFSIKDRSSDTLDMDVTYCQYVEMYKRLGLEKYGALLSCSRDEYMFEGFNSNLSFSRTGTLMEHCPCCDFHLRPKSYNAMKE